MKGHSASTWVYLKSGKKHRILYIILVFQNQIPRNLNKSSCCHLQEQTTILAIVSHVQNTIIAILPTGWMLSKVNKRLVPSQMIEHIDRHSILKEKISGYRKGHLTTMVLLVCTSEMASSKLWREVKLTMATFADFSKVFNMVDHTRTLGKSAQNGFPKALSTLDSKLRQFVQVNDKTSELIDVQFGVPQGLRFWTSLI